jgi:hypothetical protein
MKKITQEEFERRGREIFGDRFDYSVSVYTGNSSLVKIRCPAHDRIFKQLPINHWKGFSGCVDCSCGGIAYDLDDWCKRAAIRHNNRYDYSKVVYENSKTIVDIGCPIHGIFQQIADVHLWGGICPDCELAERCKAFLDEAAIVHSGKYDYSKVVYITAHDKVIIGCPQPKHGYFLQEPSAHLAGSGCKKCAAFGCSKPERAWLDELGVPEEYRQAAFKVGNKQYRADAFDPTTNTIYEFYGDYWHGNPRVFPPDKINRHNKTTFGQLYKDTIEREQALTKSGYNVVAIWEDEFKKLPRKTSPSA